MNVTRYWIDGTSIKSAEGEINESNDFVIDVFGIGIAKRIIRNGFHFETKQEAFNNYVMGAEEKIEVLKNKIELVRSQL